VIGFASAVVLVCCHPLYSVVPGHEQTWGFWVSTVVIVTGVVGLYITFKVKDWL
jgi:Na+/melibiose symporter-like transporter